VESRKYPLKREAGLKTFKDPFSNTFSASKWCWTASQKNIIEA
jgi:hypothetical protein